MSNKYIYIDALRGIAALVVVGAHYAGAFYPSTVFGSAYLAHGAWEQGFTRTPLGLLINGPFAVNMFFILSGYVLSRPYLAPPQLSTVKLLGAALKRPIRLGGLVIASVLLAFALLRAGLFFNVDASQETLSVPWFKSFWSGGDISLMRLASDLVLRPFESGDTYNPPLWTIQIELYGSLLTFLFVLLFRKTRWRIAAYALAFAVGSSTPYVGFLIGIVLADVGARLNTQNDLPCWRGVRWLLLVGGIGMASYPPHVPAKELAHTLYGTFPVAQNIYGGYALIGASLIFVAVLHSPGFQRVLTRRSFAYLGRLSYAIYVSHFILLGSFSSWFFIHVRPLCGYHIAVLMVLGVSSVLLWLVALGLTKFVDEPAVELSGRIARYWQEIWRDRAGRAG